MAELNLIAGAMGAQEMNSDLPAFEKRPLGRVKPFVASLFGANLVQLIPFDDGHFRVIFKADHFVLQDSASAPTKSQWNTLKKQMKRRDRKIFVFKETGHVKCDGEDPPSSCYYVDFGYFRDAG